MQNLANLAILNFSSATRGGKCKHTFGIYGHLVKKVSYRPLKDGLAVELLRETYKGV